MTLRDSKLYYSSTIKAISNSHLAVPCILSYVSGKAGSGTFLINLHFVNTVAQFFINKLRGIFTYQIHIGCLSWKSQNTHFHFRIRIWYL